jgi:hypothetical protein
MATESCWGLSLSLEAKSIWMVGEDIVGHIKAAESVPGFVQNNGNIAREVDEGN